MKKLFFVLSLFAFCLKANAQKEIQTPHLSPALRFTENIGQWDANILFRTQLDGGGLFMEHNGLTFNFYDKKKYRSLHHGGITRGTYKDDIINCHSYKIQFQNCNAALIEKMEEGGDYENYFLGNDKSKWKSDVKNYHRVWYKDLYNNIDYEAITTTQGIKYNFHVKPGAKPKTIQLKYEGLDNIKLLNGTLVYTLTVNSVIEQKPYAYQLINGKVTEVVCNYNLKNNVLGFDFPNGYNLNYELVIDPILVFAAQSGSTADNFGMTATWDAYGNFYSGGTCFGMGYPATVGAYSINFNGTPASGNTDVVITKYNPNGTALLFATYIGGAQSEIVTSLIVDNNNNLCMFGATGSSNFPITAGTFDNSFNGGQPISFVYNGTDFTNGTDIYIGKFNSSGTTLIASTFLGGSNNDGVNHVNNLTPLPFPNNNIFEYQVDSLQHNYGDQYRGEIQIDGYNNIYIASSTRSPNFPTVNAFDNTLGGQQDAIVAKFNPGLNQLLYSTYLGGSYNDCGNSLIVNNNQEVYITGGTCSANYPTTGGAYATNYSGGIADGYISHLSTTSNSLLHSTFVGTTNYDQSYFIQNDKNNNIYIYGQSLGNMPVIAAGYNNPGTHQFISRYNSTLSNVNLSTVIGSNTTNTDISPSAFSVDKCGNIYLSGWGGSILPGSTALSGMPLQSPNQSTTNGYDFYLMALSANANSLLYGSYFGGSTSSEHVDGGTSRIDKNGKFYQSVCAGCGGNDDFPVTPGAWPNTPGDPNHSQNCNNGVFKVDMGLSLAASNIGVSYSGCLPLNATFYNNTPGSSFTWYLGNTVTNSVTTNPVVTYTSLGTYTVSLVVYDPATCNQKDSSTVFISVTGITPTLTVSSSNSTICSGTSATLTASGATSYSWSNGSSSSIAIITPTTTTSYTVTGTNTGGCSTSSVITQVVGTCDGIKEISGLDKKFEVYPNPNSGQFYIKGNSALDKLQLEIFDMNGKLIQKTNLESENKFIDLGTKAKGIYLLKIYKDKDLISSGKIIVD